MAQQPRFFSPSTYTRKSVQDFAADIFGIKDIKKGLGAISQSGINPFDNKKADFGQFAKGVGQTALGGAFLIPGLGLAGGAAKLGAKGAIAATKAAQGTKFIKAATKTPLGKATTQGATKVSAAAKPLVQTATKVASPVTTRIGKANQFLGKGLYPAKTKAGKIVSSLTTSPISLLALGKGFGPGLMQGLNQAQAGSVPAYDTSPWSSADDTFGYTLSRGPETNTGKGPSTGGGTGTGTGGGTGTGTGTGGGSTGMGGGNTYQTYQNTYGGGGGGSSTNTTTSGGTGGGFTDSQNAARLAAEEKARADRTTTTTTTETGTPGSTNINGGSNATSPQQGTPMLGAFQNANAKFLADLAGVQASSAAQDAALREQYSQNIMGVRGGAADIIGGRAPAILGQGTTGARRSYTTGQVTRELDRLAEEEALRRGYGSTITKATSAEAKKVLEEAERKARAAKIRDMGVA